MTRSTNRRRFIGTGAALTAGVGYFASSTPRSLHAQDTPAQQLTGACIGVGGKGGSDTSHISEQGVEILGLCDVDQSTLTKKSREFPNSKSFQDFREMLDKLGDKVDVVSVSTPDHTHCSAAVRAMQMGKHVYCQKPLTWSIGEARMMREVAEQAGVVTQMGNQGSSQDGLREAVEVIQSGAIGDVAEVHIWSNRPVWPQGIGRPEQTDPVPAELNWDAWIGPAPMRPYVEGVYHSFKWRGWTDFGTGALGDMACHTTNMPVKALQLWDPIAVTALKNPGIFEGETYPGSSALMFEFPERGGLPACKFYWYDGGNLPADDVIAKLPQSFQERLENQKKNPNQKTSGALVLGSEGSLFSPDDYGGKYYLLPENDFADYTPPKQTLPRIPWNGGTDERQKWEFIETIKGDYEPGTFSNFGYAGRLTETILVGNLAMRAGQGQRIEWDAEKLMSPNVPDVNQFVNREARAGWGVEQMV